MSYSDWAVCVQSDRLVRAGVVRADRPAGHALDAALDPPAVQDAQRRHAVQRRLHAAGARRLERALGRVQPDVHARRQESREFHVVVRQVHDRHAARQGLADLHDPLDQLLARFVLRVGLAGEDELQSAVLARDPPQPLDVVEEQVGPLVGRGAASEAERQHVDVEPGVGLPVHGFDEPAFGLPMGGPDLVGWNAQGVTQAEIVLLASRRCSGRTARGTAARPRWRRGHRS